jgi:hypothetical protein
MDHMPLTVESADAEELGTALLQVLSLSLDTDDRRLAHQLDRWLLLQLDQLLSSR